MGGGGGGRIVTDRQKFTHIHVYVKKILLLKHFAKLATDITQRAANFVNPGSAQKAFHILGKMPSYL